MNAQLIRHPLSAAVATLLLLGVAHAFAAGNAAPAGSTASQADATAPIYGSQMMTAEERTAYRQKMRDAKTFEEQERIRTEHHSAMQARAKERGLTLPDVPPARGPGMGPGTGPGMGGGMGPGMGRGPGDGPGMGPGGGPGRGAGRASP